MAGQILHELSHRNTAGFHVVAAGAAWEELMRLGFEAPSWESVTAGRRPAVPDVEDRQIGLPSFGWQQAATDAVHTYVVETTVRPRLNPLNRPYCVPKGARCRECRSSASLPMWCLGSTLPSSAFCSSAVFGFPFPPLHAVVGVAVPSTSLATTGQLVLKQGVGSSKVCTGVGSREDLP